MPSLLSLFKKFVSGNPELDRVQQNIAGAVDPIVKLLLDWNATTITALGTIVTGVWQGTPIADAFVSSAATWNAKAASGANTDITSVALNQTGLKVKGASSNKLNIKPNETLSAERVLNVKVNDADRTVDLAGNLTVAGAATISGTHSGTSSGTNTGDVAPSVGSALIGQKNIMWRAVKGGNSPTMDEWGVPSISTTGGTGQAFAATNTRTYIRRAQYLTAGAANASIGWRFGVLTHVITAGADANLGGFRAVCRFGFSNITSTSLRWFIGFIGSTSAIGTTADPSSITNMVGVGMDSGATVMSIMHNDGSGTATSYNSGGLTPSTAKFYQMEIINTLPTGGNVSVSVTDYPNLNAFGTAFTTDIPAADTFLGWHFHANSGASGGGGLVLGLDFSSLWIEADF